MSAGLELAAAVFAIVGVADVAIRTSRDVHGFLRNIVGAPKEIDRMCVIIKEVAVLAETAKELLGGMTKRKHRNSIPETVGLLETALKGLNRELQNLRIISAKFKGSNKTWGRVRYVLDERKTYKALESLERSKGLLANALIVANGQKLDEQQSDLSSIQDSIEEQTFSIHQGNYKILKQQAELARTSQCIHRETHRISDTVFRSHREHLDEHQKTREILCAKIEDVLSSGLERMHLPLVKHNPNRVVFFYGEQREMIMAYLLLVKPHLQAAIKNLLLEDSEAFPTDHLTWMQSEFNDFIASAAQEEAARHIASTATCVDEWHYSEREFAQLSKKPYHASEYQKKEEYNTGEITKHTHANSFLSKPMMRNRPSYTQSTPFGSLRVYLPTYSSSNKTQRPNQEAELTFTCGIGASINIIHVHFLRNNITTGFPAPKLYTQLSVFTLAESEDHYENLFAHASAAEIDTALRKGVISPYHMNREGRNLCLYYAAEYARTDILEYFDGQGIGVSNLNQDISLIAGLFINSISPHITREMHESSVDHVLSRVSDRISFLFETTMNMLLWDYYKGRPKRLLQRQIERLRSEGLLSKGSFLGTGDGDDGGWNMKDNGDEAWDWPSASALITPLFQHDATNVDTIGSLGRNRIQRCWCILSRFENSDSTPTSNSTSAPNPVSKAEKGEEEASASGSQKAISEIATALIRAGVDIHHRDHDGWTPSMYARRYGAWEQWCGALESNGFVVEDVLREEGAEWLGEEERWRGVWLERYGRIR